MASAHNFAHNFTQRHEASDSQRFLPSSDRPRSPAPQSAVVEADAAGTASGTANGTAGAVNGRPGWHDDPRRPTSRAGWLAPDCSIRTSNVSVIEDDPHNPIPDSIFHGGANVTWTLFRCRRLVLRPFVFLLEFISWYPFPYRYQSAGVVGAGDESSPRRVCNGVVGFLNAGYPIFVLLFLIYSYVYEALACHGRISVKPSNESRGQELELAALLAGGGGSFPAKCPHLVTTSVLPSLLHLIVFVIGFYSFRIQQYESFFSLLEKVFIETAPYFSASFSQKRIVRRLRLFLLLSLFWVIASVGQDILYVVAFGLDSPADGLVRTVLLPAPSSPAWLARWLPWILDLLGSLLRRAVYAAVLLDYATECEIIRFSVLGLEMRLQERTAPLERAFKDVLHLRAKVAALNGVVGRMASVVTASSGIGVVVGVRFFVLDGSDAGVAASIYHALFLIVWTAAFLTSLVQAARVNVALDNIQSLALDGRGFGYPGASSHELDSFLSFSAHAPIRAKICHVPVASTALVVVVVIVVASLLVLVQLNVILPVATAF